MCVCVCVCVCVRVCVRVCVCVCVYIYIYTYLKVGHINETTFLWLWVSRLRDHQTDFEVCTSSSFFIRVLKVERFPLLMESKLKT